MIVANYEAKWEPLSKEHENIDREIQRILEHYKNETSIESFAYAILGTYGIGKTQLLYQIHKYSIEKEIIPLYFLAEDLFREIIKETEDYQWTPGEVYSLVEKKIDEIRKCLNNRDRAGLENIIDPRGKIRKDCPLLIDRIIEKFPHSISEKTKIILLVDELEGQYGNLQNIVQTKDRSPLREWLESKTHLKFLALAPAGIYELGGADRDRVKRIVIPSADVKYIRENVIRDAGRSNSCWWVSRGKARQLFKALDVLRKLNQSLDSDEASRIIRTELDPIGQPPTEVPPAVIDRIKPSQVPYLFKLSPKKIEKGRRYVIDTENLNVGEFADKLIEAFKINKDNAILLAEYFKKTIRTLSDENWLTYIDENDLSELFSITLDHFLEYEHGSPELSKRFGEILGLYERTKEEHAAVYGVIGKLWEYKEVEIGLPLSIGEIREVFPFPTMNPIVKNYVPADMKQRWEGRGRPIWRWTEGYITVLFFASKRDFNEYWKSDEFLDSALPDGKSVLCFLPHGENIKTDTEPLLGWLENRDKLRIEYLPHLLTDFLLSASGELDDIPGDLMEILKEFKENKEDLLLSRRAEIYGKTLNDTVQDSLPKPELIYKGKPPYSEKVWGNNQIGHRKVAISGVALVFANLKPEEKLLLADIRELFKGGREGKGIGDLRFLISGREAPGRGGHTRLPDRLLPYRTKGGKIRDTEIVEGLRNYWRKDEKEKLEDLARILRLDDFLKLHPDEDVNRLLEAIWRVTRKEFDIEEEEIQNISVKLKNEIIPTLEKCYNLEKRANTFGLDGIDFGEYERSVKSLSGFKRLSEVINRSSKSSEVVKSIIILLSENIEEIEDEITELDDLCSDTEWALEDLQESAENLKRNFSEYRKAMKFLGLKKKDLDKIIKANTKVEGVLSLEDIKEKAKENREYLDEISQKITELEDTLNDIDNRLSQIKGGD